VPVSGGLLIVLIVLRRQTLLWLVVLVGILTGKPDRREFCERTMTRLSYRPPLLPRRRELLALRSASYLPPSRFR
jgi:hypothetical protein